MRPSTKIGPLALLVLLTSVASCGSDEEDEPQVPNPASAFCGQQGGTLEIEEDASGNQRGICVLPSGERVDEWEYYRDHGGVPTTS